MIRIGTSSFCSATGQGPSDKTHISIDGTLVAELAFEDAIRDDAESVIAWMRLRGLELGVSSGDDDDRTLAVARSLGMPTAGVKGHQSPAAKGLEVPIAFVVNMGRGTGGPRAPIRVTDDAGGDASVAIADYQSEADEDAQARDREETKRLLYVALTRARDFLYLSTTVKEGACRMGRGSLGEVLPAPVRAMFIAAAADAVDRPRQQFARSVATAAQVNDFGTLRV